MMAMRSEKLEEKSYPERVADRLAARGLFDYAHRAAKDHHVFVGEVLGDSKRRPIAYARQALWRALHDDAGLSWPMIGEIFEKRHDSIVHATSYRESRARDSVERRVIDAIASYVRQIGYTVLAQEISSGAWRDRPTPRIPLPEQKCVVPSCPHLAKEGYNGACYLHRKGKR